MDFSVQPKANGIVLFLTAVFLFATLDAVSKYLTAFFAVPLLMWARYVLHLVFMLVAVVPKMGRRIVVTQRPWLMILRGLLQVGCSLFVLLAFRTLPLAETTAVVFITPLLVALLAGPMLGEKLALGHWLAVLAGFVGVLLIARPGGAMVGSGIAYALCSALCYAFYQILTRKLSATEPPMRQLFYLALVGTVVMTLVLPAYWSAVVPTPMQAGLIIWYGLCAAFGHFLFIRALHETPASILAPLLYFQLIWAVVLGWGVFGHWPDLSAMVGMLIIGLSGLSLVLRQSRATPPEPSPVQ
jgi:drug/metabolite transporter (DMT)-like permease